MYVCMYECIYISRLNGRMNKSTRKAQTSAKASPSTESLLNGVGHKILQYWPYRVMAKKSLKILGSGSWSVWAAKSNGLLPARQPPPFENFVRICRKLLDLSAYYAEYPLSHNGKNAFKNFKMRLQIQMTSKI